MAVTLKDIARTVGVSVNTVSHVLNGKTDISEETARRVRDAAEKLGYRPNLNARSLVQKKTRTVGLAVTESDNPVRTALCEELHNLAERDGYRILNVSLKYAWDTGNIRAVDELLARRVDGLVIGTVWNGSELCYLEDILAECRNSRLPAVLFGDPRPGLADSVVIDMGERARIITRHLLERGRRRIVILVRPERTDLIGGCRQAVEQSGSGATLTVIPEFAGRMQPAYDALCRFLDSAPLLPDAFIAGNDLGALGFLAALRGRGIRVPEQCAVAGFDNIEFSRFSSPPLTTIGYESTELAGLIWGMMQDRLKGQCPDGFRRVVIPQKLFVRESS